MLEGTLNTAQSNPPSGNGRSVTIWGKIIKIVATKYYFGWGSASDHAGGDYSACPEPLEGGRPTSKDGWKGREKEGKGLRREGKRGEEM